MRISKLLVLLVALAVVLLIALAVVLLLGGGAAAPPGRDPLDITGPPSRDPLSAGSSQLASAGNAIDGRKLFASSCAACHGPEGKGIQGLGKDMTGSAFIAGLSDAQLLDFVKQGRSVDDPMNTTGVAMPPKGGNPALTDAQLMDIVAYMRSIAQ